MSRGSVGAQEARVHSKVLSWLLGSETIYHMRTLYKGSHGKAPILLETVFVRIHV